MLTCLCAEPPHAGVEPPHAGEEPPLAESLVGVLGWGTNQAKTEHPPARTVFTVQQDGPFAYETSRTTCWVPWRATSAVEWWLL